MSKKITLSKVDEVANTLLSEKYKQINSIENEISEIFTKCWMQDVPAEILDIHKKYKGSISTMRNICWCNPNSYAAFYIKVDNLPKFNLNLRNEDAETYNNIYNIYNIFEKYHPKEYNLINEKFKKIKEIEKANYILGKTIRCILKTLSTYAKIKVEYPEAYDILIKIDEDIEKNKKTNIADVRESLCDSVESVRAKLK